MTPKKNGLHGNPFFIFFISLIVWILPLTLTLTLTFEDVFYMIVVFADAIHHSAHRRRVEEEEEEVHIVVEQEEYMAKS